MRLRLAAELGASSNVILSKSVRDLSSLRGVARFARFAAVAGLPAPAPGRSAVGCSSGASAHPRRALHLKDDPLRFSLDIRSSQHTETLWVLCRICHVQ